MNNNQLEFSTVLRSASHSAKHCVQIDVTNLVVTMSFARVAELHCLITLLTREFCSGHVSCQSLTVKVESGQTLPVLVSRARVLCRVKIIVTH